MSSEQNRVEPLLRGHQFNGKLLSSQLSKSYGSYCFTSIKQPAPFDEGPRIHFPEGGWRTYENLLLNVSSSSLAS